jgi:hypothetical protein
MSVQIAKSWIVATMLILDFHRKGYAVAFGLMRQS